MNRNWRTLLSYPQCLPQWVRSTLDTLAELLPPPEVEDRFVCLADWLREAEKCGLLTDREHHKLRCMLAPEM